MCRASIHINLKLIHCLYKSVRSFILRTFVELKLGLFCGKIIKGLKSVREDTYLPEENEFVLTEASEHRLVFK